MPCSLKGEEGEGGALAEKVVRTIAAFGDPGQGPLPKLPTLLCGYCSLGMDGFVYLCYGKSPLAGPALSFLQCRQTSRLGVLEVSCVLAQDKPFGSSGASLPVQPKEFARTAGDF